MSSNNFQTQTRLREAELAELTAYATAPETLSPHYVHFDAEALRAQRGWRRLFRVSAGLLVFVSLSSSVTGLGSWLVAQQWLPLTGVRLLDGVGVSLTLLGLALEIGLQLYWRRQLRPWISARNCAETLRGLVWRYLLALPLTGYSAARQVPVSADLEWAEAMQRLIVTGGAVPPSLSSEVPTTLVVWRERLTGILPAGQLQAYIQARLATQQEFFTMRSRELATKAQSWTKIGYGLLGLALAWNAARLVAITQNWPLAIAFFNFNFSLVVIGGVSLVRAYVESEDMEPLAARYQRLARELKQRQGYLPTAPMSVAAVQEFVLATEQLLREETADWLGRRGG